MGRLGLHIYTISHLRVRGLGCRIGTGDIVVGSSKLTGFSEKTSGWKNNARCGKRAGGSDLSEKTWTEFFVEVKCQILGIYNFSGIIWGVFFQEVVSIVKADRVAGAPLRLPRTASSKVISDIRGANTNPASLSSAADHGTVEDRLPGQ